MFYVPLFATTKQTWYDSKVCWMSSSSNIGFAFTTTKTGSTTWLQSEDSVACEQTSGLREILLPYVFLAVQCSSNIARRARNVMSAGILSYNRSLIFQCISAGAVFATKTEVNMNGTASFEDNSASSDGGEDVSMER